LFSNPANCIDIDLNAPLPWPFLFWDVLHPTSRWHGAIGTAMFDALLAAHR
jgi:phospholipase/lecithinase/hemolysin